MITFPCVFCGRPMEAPQSEAGNIQTCPACRENVLVALPPSRPAAGALKPPISGWASAAAWLVAMAGACALTGLILLASAGYRAERATRQRGVFGPAGVPVDYQFEQLVRGLAGWVQAQVALSAGLLLMLGALVCMLLTRLPRPPFPEAPGQPPSPATHAKGGGGLSGEGGVRGPPGASRP